MPTIDWNRQRIIFVCSGNICRSPMAVELARLFFAERGWQPLIISMGTLGLINQPAQPHACTAIAEVGGDLSAHRSQALSATLANAADFCFGMESEHVVAIRQCGPKAHAAARLLAAYATPPLPEVFDPIGTSLNSYRACRDLIQGCIHQWFSMAV